MRWLLLLALITELLSGADLGDRFERATQGSPVVERGFWGGQVVDLETGAVLYERNADRLFMPASNTKLFSTSLALLRLGPDHRFRTLLLAEGQPDADGLLRGDLRFYGGGDPTLSARQVPYQTKPSRGDPLGPLNELADQLVSRGLKRIAGDIVGDDSAYVWEPYPDGWTNEDSAWEYGAPVSALTLHDNSFKISILAAKRIGDPGRIFLKPTAEYYTLHNHVRTVSKGESRVDLDWQPGANELHLWGTVRPRAGRAKLLAIREPAHYAAWVLARALRERGVEIHGGLRTRHLTLREVSGGKSLPEPASIPGTPLVERVSPPLFEILRITNKVSQNLHAELVLREVGRVRRNLGSLEAGLAELDDFLQEIGVSKSAYHFEDGSGLSRMNLVSPGAIVKLLSHMYLSTERDGWLDLMAVGGEDGTLHYRFKGPAERGRVLAKTGTLTGASALSGYLETRDGRMLAFSFMANNYNSRTSTARKFLDGLVGVLLE